MSYQIILAPLQGYTDAIFRDVYFRRFVGIDQAMAPFISTLSQKKISLTTLKDILPDNNQNCLNLIPQILGNIAEDFIILANHILEFGCDTINLNMGCPHSKVAKKKRGSGMLPYPEMVDQLLDNLFKGLSLDSAGELELKQLKCKISVKVRLGRYDKNEIFDLLPIFEKYPLEEIIVHPRTGVQMYEGKVDIDSFIKVADNTSHRLVYNGDITSVRVFEDIVRQLEKVRRYGQSSHSYTPIDRFMIGRGILSNPFLPSQIKKMSCGNREIQYIDMDIDMENLKKIRVQSDVLERIKCFHDELFETYSCKFYGPLHVTGRMKGFWTYIGESFKENKKEIKKILKSKNREHYKFAAENFFNHKPIFKPSN